MNPLWCHHFDLVRLAGSGISFWTKTSSYCHFSSRVVTSGRQVPFVWLGFCHSMDSSVQLISKIYSNPVYFILSNLVQDYLKRYSGLLCQRKSIPSQSSKWTPQVAASSHLFLVSYSLNELTYWVNPHTNSATTPSSNSSNWQLSYALNSDSWYPEWQALITDQWAAITAAPWSLDS